MEEAGLPHRCRRVLPASFAGIALALTLTACSTPGTGSGSTSTPTSTSGSSTSVTTTGAAQIPPIRHVFVIVLENQGYDSTFGSPAADPYLARTLPAEGALLSEYHGIGHFSNDNYIAMVSGQAPNLLNQADCPAFLDFPSRATLSADGQISRSGCVFPSSVATVADQLDRAHLTWKGYMEDMGNDPSREAQVCGHPAVGSLDHTQKAVAGDGYATRHNPFVYFHSVIDDTALCDTHVVPLGTTSGSLPKGTPSGVTGLATDLRSVTTTANFSFVTPNLCNDGHDAPCINQQANASAAANIDAYLERWVPLITSSPAFRKDGLLEITFDEADTSDSSACCNEQPGPASPLPGITGPGGGRTGAVLLSPFIKAGTVSSVPYNHYSTLATVEELFGLPRLGQAKTVSATFGRDVFATAG
jgi:phosphatidylinositol-3-phosphatase